MWLTTFVEANTIETLTSEVNDLEATGAKYVDLVIGQRGTMPVYVAVLQMWDGDEEEGGTADAASA